MILEYQSKILSLSFKIKKKKLEEYAKWTGIGKNFNADSKLVYYIWNEKANPAAAAKIALEKSYHKSDTMQKTKIILCMENILNSFHIAWEGIYIIFSINLLNIFVRFSTSKSILPVRYVVINSNKKLCSNSAGKIFKLLERNKITTDLHCGVIG
jgi:hypothetical protein